MVEKRETVGEEQVDNNLKTCPNCKKHALFWTNRQLWECYECNRTYTSARYEKMLLIGKRNKEARKKAERQYHDEYGRVGLCPFCGNSDINPFTSQTWKCNNCFREFPIPSFSTERPR